MSASLESNYCPKLNLNDTGADSSNMLLMPQNLIKANGPSTLGPFNNGLSSSLEALSLGNSNSTMKIAPRSRVDSKGKKTFLTPQRNSKK